MDKKDFEKLIERANKMKSEGKIDLSMEEDLSIAVMNLVSLEEHFFFTASKTGEDKYLNFLKEVREVRKNVLAKMINKHEGETWCIVKHLLAATMRLIEAGIKSQSENKQKEAKEFFKNAYKIYSLFWAIRLSLLKLDDLRKIRDDKLNVHDKEKAKKCEQWTLEDITNKLIDCCDE